MTQTWNRPKVFYKMTCAQEGGISISKGLYNTFWVAANISNVSTDNDWAIFSNKTTIISSFSFRITTTIPALWLSRWTWTQVFLLNSDRRLRIDSRILWGGKQDSLLQICFVNTTLTRPPSQIIPAWEVAYPPLKQCPKGSEDEDYQFSPSRKISSSWFYGHYNPQCLLWGGKQSSLLLILFRQHHID